MSGRFRHVDCCASGALVAISYRVFPDVDTPATDPFGTGFCDERGRIRGLTPPKLQSTLADYD